MRFLTAIVSFITDIMGGDLYMIYLTMLPILIPERAFSIYNNASYKQRFFFKFPFMSIFKTDTDIIITIVGK